MRWVTGQSKFLFDGKDIYYLLHKKTKINKKETILIILDTDIVIPPTTGVTYRFYELSRKMVETGHKVVWIVSNRRKTGWDTLDDLRGLGIEIHLIDIQRFYDINFITKLVKKINPSVLQFESAQAMIRFGIPLRRKLKVPILLELHDVDSILRKEFDQTSKIELANFIQRVACYECDALVVMTQDDYRYFTQTLSVPESKIFLAPNGIEPGIVPNIRTQKHVALFLGNLFYQPNYDAFVEFADKVMPIVHKKFPQIKLVSMGRTPDDLKKKYKNVHYICLKGEVLDLAVFKDVLESSFVGLCTVRAGSGMKVKNLIYASNAIPIIATRVGAAGYERIKPILIGETPEDWFRNLSMLYSDRAIRKKIALSTKKLVDKYYSWQSILQTVLRAMDSAKQFDKQKMKIDSCDEIWLEERRVPKNIKKGYKIIN